VHRRSRRSLSLSLSLSFSLTLSHTHSPSRSRPLLLTLTLPLSYSSSYVFLLSSPATASTSTSACLVDLCPARALPGTCSSVGTKRLQCGRLATSSPFTRCVCVWGHAPQSFSPIPKPSDGAPSLFACPPRQASYAHPCLSLRTLFPLVGAPSSGLPAKTARPRLPWPIALPSPSFFFVVPY
jgi:hypothetical protein